MNHKENNDKLTKYLKSIGGLKNGYFEDREPITNSAFFEIGEGWHNLVIELIEELIKAGWDKKVCQVKEKFGGLRFYTLLSTNEQDEIIDKYENISYEICDICGRPGDLRGKGWVMTRCEEHKP